jgi:uncharacterized spore protein YtfJ
MGVEETIKQIASNLKKVASTKLFVGSYYSCRENKSSPFSKISMGYSSRRRGRQKI